MTVSTTINREQYATDGVTTAFTIHFAFFDDTDVNAAFVDSSGVSTTLAINTDYTVTGGDGAGGTLTTNSTLASGGILTAFREIPFTQEDDYVENDPLPAGTLESGFDRGVMRDQQLQDAANRSLSFPPTIASGVSAELPNPIGDQILGWASDGLSLVNKNVPEGTTVYASTADTNTGTATNEAVTPKGLHDSVYNVDGVIVAVTGETTAVATGTAKKTWRMPYKGLGLYVRASLTVAQTSGSILTVDINKGGVSILSTKLTIDNTEKTSVTAAAAAVISDTAWSDDAEFTIDVDQVGDGTAQGLKVELVWRNVA